MFSNKTALVIAPHPDDEVFGCGGLIAKMIRQNCKVYVLYVTVGETRDFSNKGSSGPQERIKEIENVADFYQFEDYELALPGNEYHLKLDSLPNSKLISLIERDARCSLQNVKPDILIAPDHDDYNQDHRALYSAVITATRPAEARFKHFQPLVITYELPYSNWGHSESPERPNLYVELTDEDFARKVEALKFYSSQLKSENSPLSVNGITIQAKYRGLQTQSNYAEAFKIKRLIV
ncbi:hypothetical protein AB833_18645 [Chromatiales bacterium (ex Bugula neritina AB1)]|nr:hypothetical protein AB833_18645 [Chromatiales bacterium (ex Bugula neritina AB1)]